MSRPVDFGPHGEFSPGEITYVIELLSAMCPVDEIQDMFLKFTNGVKPIPGQVIQQIQLKYADKIRRQNEMYISNVDGNPLAHLRVRLDIAYKILRDALKPEPSHTLKKSNDEYEIVYKIDRTNALNALKLVMTDLNNREKLDNDKAKKAEGEGIEEISKEWNVEDGLG